jgi:hypothetical protein
MNQQTRRPLTVTSALVDLHNWTKAQADDLCDSNVFERTCEGRGYRAVEQKLRQMIAAASHEDRAQLLHTQQAGLFPNAQYLFSVACLVGVVVLAIVLLFTKVL